MPTPEEARNVFQARRAIEKTIVRNVVGNAGRNDIARLRAHNEKERAARGSGSRREAIRMSGEFHRILGEIGQNDVLGDFVKELVLRSSLIIGLYAPMSARLCEDQEHREIVDAIEAGDEAKAIDLIDAHLRHLEDSIQFEKDGESDDLREILAGG